MTLGHEGHEGHEGYEAVKAHDNVGHDGHEGTMLATRASSVAIRIRRTPLGSGR